MLIVLANVSSIVSGCKLVLWSLLYCAMISLMLMVGSLLVMFIPIPGQKEYFFNVKPKFTWDVTLDCRNNIIYPYITVRMLCCKLLSNLLIWSSQILILEVTHLTFNFLHYPNSVNLIQLKFQIFDSKDQSNVRSVKAFIWSLFGHNASATPVVWLEKHLIQSSKCNFC